jgi:predicted Zn-dependent peptidase
LFWISAVVKPDKSLQEVEKVIYDEIERLKQDPVADWELEKVQMKLRLQQAQALYSTRSRANSLGHYAVYYNEPDLINTALNKIMQVTNTDLRRVAENFLRAANRTVVTTVPKSKAGT